MLASVRRIAGTRGLAVEVHLGQLVDTAGRTRRETAEAVATRIRMTTTGAPARAGRRRVRIVRKTPARVGSGQRRRLVLGRGTLGG